MKSIYIIDDLDQTTIYGSRMGEDALSISTDQSFEHNTNYDEIMDNIYLEMRVMGMSRKNRFHDMITSSFHENANAILDNSREELMLMRNNIMIY